MRFPFLLFIVYICSTTIACTSCSNDNDGKDSGTTKYRTFVGMSYRHAFNDMQDVHIAAARKNGISPLVNRADTVYHTNDLVRLPQELEIYRVNDLSHSIPYLVPKASQLLSDIGVNFRDSLVNKDLPLYKLIVTSVTRTDEDVKKLRRRNYNASEESTHCYATTFDIAWVRYVKVDDHDQRSIDDGQLKSVLGQVLFDLKERGRCYIKHELKQSCFHITVR